VRFGMLIKTTGGFELGGAASAASSRSSVPFVAAGSLFDIEFEVTCHLNSGVYFMNAGVVGELNGSETYMHRLIDICMFRVIAESSNLNTGVVDFNCAPEVKKVEVHDEVRCKNS
jgi:lipopolysaccharide transport system ATP-binding protein